MKLLKLSVIAALAITATIALAADKAQIFTGEVSDSMCGAKHMMAGKPGECARACVGKGSSYALVVGDKVYALHAQDNSPQEGLKKLACGQATFTATPHRATLYSTNTP